MGSITPDKKIYDQKTVEAFQRMGWKAFAIAKTGRYADVIGIKGSSLAVIEVKNPNETSAVRSYDDAANLSPDLQKKVGQYLSETREKVFNLFGRGKSIQQLYAVSVTSQLYRYIYEFDEKAPELFISVMATSWSDIIKKLFYIKTEYGLQLKKT